jgi:hypothetical protein
MPLSEEDHLKSAQAKFNLLQMFGKDPMVNPTEVDQARVLELLPDAVAADFDEFLFNATVIGDLRVVEALRSYLGPLTLTYELKAGGRVSSVNGISFKPQRNGVLRHCNSIAEVKQFFSVIKALGFKGLVEPGPTVPYFYSENNQTYDHILGVVRAAQFKGELPFLEAGVLKSPELAISLSEESFYSATPDAFMPMLCWATEAMVQEFSEALKPVEFMQSISFETAKRGYAKSYSSMPVAMYKAKQQPCDAVIVTGIGVGLKSSHLHSEWLSNLNHYMGNEFTRNGFADTDGRILCETRVDFLLSFPADFCAESNLLESKRFATEYIPFDILAIQALKACTELYGHPQQSYATFAMPHAKSYRHAFNPLFEIMGSQSPLREPLLDLLTREQWLDIARKAESVSFTAKALIALRDTFGLDNQGMILRFRPEDLDTLRQAGYQFVSNTALMIDDTSQDAEDEPPHVTGVRLNLSGYSVSFTLEDDNAETLLAETLRYHGLAQSMNLWSCKTPKPATVQQALKQIVDLNIANTEHVQAMALYAFLVGQGIAACAKEATSPEEWLRVVEMFSDREIEPYLSIMPRQAKGRALENQLGL